MRQPEVGGAAGAGRDCTALTCAKVGFELKGMGGGAADFAASFPSATDNPVLSSRNSVRLSSSRIL